MTFFLCLRLCGSTDADERMNQLLMDADRLLALCESDYNDSTEYDLFVWCLSEQTLVESEKRRFRTKEDGGMKSTMMQNPSDSKATFRSKYETKQSVCRLLSAWAARNSRSGKLCPKSGTCIKKGREYQAYILKSLVTYYKIWIFQGAIEIVAKLFMVLTPTSFLIILLSLFHFSIKIQNYLLPNFLLKYNSLIFFLMVNL